MFSSPYSSMKNDVDFHDVSIPNKYVMRCYVPKGRLKERLRCEQNHINRLQFKILLTRHRCYLLSLAQYGTRLHVWSTQLPLSPMLCCNGQVILQVSVNLKKSRLKEGFVSQVLIGYNFIFFSINFLLSLFLMILQFSFFLRSLFRSDL